MEGRGKGRQKVTMRAAEILAKTRLFSEMNISDLEPLATHARTQNLSSGDILFTAGEPSSHWFIVVSGRTRALRHGSDGREQIIHEDLPYSSFSEVAVFDRGPYPSTVIAVEDSQLLTAPSEQLRHFCLQNPSAALAALELMSQRLRKATGLVEDLALREVGQRLAEYLLRTAAKTAGDNFDLELQHTNQEIADSIGTVREVVSRGFSRFQRKGWIHKQGRSVQILQLDKLRDYMIGVD